MNVDATGLVVNGVKYVREDSVPVHPVMDDDMFVVRTRSAGVFFGAIMERGGLEVRMTNARRLWYWSGAASLSQLAMEGVKNPSECKFSMPVASVVLTEVIEIISCTSDAVANIAKVPEWKN